MTIIGPSWPLDHQDRQDHQVMSTYVRLAVSLFSSLYQHSISSFASDTPVIHIIKRVVFRGGILVTMYLDIQYMNWYDV